MARKPRIEYDGALYHVTARGNQRADVFLGDPDREYFLDLLGKTAARLGWRVHAYCLMGNHYHLLVETPQANLGKGMQVLGTTYTQAFNRRNGKVGHVFQGRYKALIIEKESHLLEVARYIVNNPVASSFAAHPSDWPWSSYRATVGLSAAPEWLETGWTLARFHPSDRKKAVKRYRQFVERSSEGNPLEAPRLGLIVGSERFAEEMKHLVEGSLAKDSSARADAARVPLAALFARRKSKAGRNAAILDAYDRKGYSLAEIARHLGMHESSICRIVKLERGKC